MPYPKPLDAQRAVANRVRSNSALRLPALTAGPRVGRALPGVLFALLVIGVYADPLFFRRNFAGRDLFSYNLPLERAIHDAYSRGRLPVWISEISGGRPLLPNPNSGALYPVRPLLSLVRFPLAARLYPVLHWILAGWGVIVLLRTIGASPGAAWLSAVTYVFSGVGISEVFYPHIQPGMSLLPWIVWAVARPFRSAVPRVLLLAFLVALCLLAGDVFTIGLAVACAFFWIARESERSARLRLCGAVAGALALAVLAAAPQILATALWVPETTRAVLGLNFRQSFFLSVSPLRLLELVVPYPFGETWTLEDRIWAWPVFNGKSVGLFTTLFAGSFAAFALVALWKRRGPGLRFARLVFLFGVLLSVPPSLFPRAWDRLPSPVPLRNPEKFTVAIAFALALFAGLAWDVCRRENPGARWPLVVGALLTVLALAAAVSPESAGRFAAAVAGETSEPASAGAYLPGALAEGGLLWISAVLAIALAARPGRVAPLIALALLTAAPIVAGRRIARTFREEEIFAPTRFVRTIRKMDPEGAYRILGQSLFRPATPATDWAVRSDPAQLEISRREWYEFAHAIWDRGTVLNWDFDRGDLSRVQTLRRLGEVASRSPGSSAFFGNLALRFGVRYRGQAPLSGYRRFGGDLLQEFDEHEASYPDIRLAERWTETTGGTRVLEQIARLSPGEILVESGASKNGASRPGRVRVLLREPERLVADVDAPDPTWLFVLRAFWSYRTVRLDGRPVDVQPAQVGFSAVPVPPGAHRIEWQERVPGIEISRYGPVLAFAAAALLLAKDRRRA
jgi:hypothetical protein